MHWYPNYKMQNKHNKITTIRAQMQATLNFHTLIDQSYPILNILLHVKCQIIIWRRREHKHWLFFVMVKSGISSFNLLLKFMIKFIKMDLNFEMNKKMLDFENLMEKCFSQVGLSIVHLFQDEILLQFNLCTYSRVRYCSSIQFMYIFNFSLDFFCTFWSNFQFMYYFRNK